MSVRYVIPLHNFELKGIDDVKFSSGMIRKCHPCCFHVLPDNTQYQYSHYALITGNNSEREPRSLLDRCLSILKLFKVGTPWADFAFMIPEERKKLGNNFSTSDPILNHYRLWGKNNTKYTISAGEAEAFGSFWLKMGTLDTDLFPVTQFSRVDYEPYLNDRLLKLITALDYLLIPGDEQRGITTNFAKRGAALMAHLIRRDLRDNYFFFFDLITNGDLGMCMLLGKSIHVIGLLCRSQNLSAEKSSCICTS